MTRGTLAPPIELTKEERASLEDLARRRSTSQAMALRARIVLRCADGGSNIEVADDLEISRLTVGKWRSRYAREREEGLYDAPRPGPPRTYNDSRIKDIVDRTLKAMPKRETHWSTRSMAAATGVSQSTVSRIWRAFSLKPHRSETFALSNDPLFVEKVRDIVGLYLNPPDNAVVLCVDEKSQIQALERQQPLLPMLGGTPERRSPRYWRHGTTTLFAALDHRAGKVVGELHRRHRAEEFVSFLRTLDATVPEKLDAHVIMDNLATHKTDQVKAWFARHPRFKPHFTPTHASWLNLVEAWFSKLTNQKLRRGSHRSVPAVETAVRDYLRATNAHPKPFVWTKTADQILESLAKYCQRITDSPH
jgi:transposase